MVRPTNRLLFVVIILTSASHVEATTTRQHSTLYEMERVERSILEQAAANCRFPSREEIVDQLRKEKPHSGTPLIDDWGQPLIYNHPARYGSASFDLYSIGANALDEHGAGDDISNWRGLDYNAYSNPNYDLETALLFVALVDFPVFLLAWAGWKGLRFFRRRPA